CIMILLVFSMLLSSCLLDIPYIRSFTDKESGELDLNEYRLSNKICETVFGIDSKTFFETKGKVTLLENGYTSATINNDGTLILQLTDSQSDQWRNSNKRLQILQKILGEERQVVTKIIPPTDPVYGTLYEDADIHCGCDISEDYSQIIARPGDDKSYQAVVPFACLMMQVLEGRPSDEIFVEYLELDSSGDVTTHICLPMYMFMFQDLDECKQLKKYEQISAEIEEYILPDGDESCDGLGYESFWGMKYRSANLSYEIFAYEFNSKNDALKYYMDATGDDKYADRLPVENSDKNIHGTKTFGNAKYQVTVIEGNKAYKLVSSNVIIDKIDEMLSVVFSVKV
ncbi:MAG: hypothetical protein IJX13_06980, partial [Clostridia bacterium]|nr:hypothetical protein [Clostridia bacterium]